MSATQTTSTNHNANHFLNLKHTKCATAQGQGYQKKHQRQSILKKHNEICFGKDGWETFCLSYFSIIRNRVSLISLQCLKTSVDISLGSEPTARQLNILFTATLNSVLINFAVNMRSGGIDDISGRSYSASTTSNLTLRKLYHVCAISCMHLIRLIYLYVVIFCGDGLDLSDNT